jgi:hypothetical protein
VIVQSRIVTLISNPTGRRLHVTASGRRTLRVQRGMARRRGDAETPRGRGPCEPTADVWIPHVRTGFGQGARLLGGLSDPENRNARAMCCMNFSPSSSTFSSIPPLPSPVLMWSSKRTHRRVQRHHVLLVGRRLQGSQESREPGSESARRPFRVDREYDVPQPIPSQRQGCCDAIHIQVGSTPVIRTKYPHRDYFMMGDDRTHTCDSRSFGAASGSSIVREVTAIDLRSGRAHVHLLSRVA